MAAREHWLVRTRAPRGSSSSPSSSVVTDPDLVSSWLQDAARYPGGEAAGVAFPDSEAAVAALLATRRPLLVVGAQSSLTGGATPHGEIVVSTSKLDAIGPWTERSVRCGAGVVLRELDAACATRGLHFPPVPTYDGATVGGAVSTDAAGAQTFAHGTVRAWVDGLTVVLACGEVLEFVRGEVSAHPGGWFEIEKLDGTRVRVPVPKPATPAVPKNSSGYRGGPGLDLVDLFVGSEGTLGVVFDATLRVAPRPAWMAALVPVESDGAAVELTRELRTQPAVSAIEYMDARSVEVLREDGVPERVGVPVPASARVLLLVQLELPAGWDRARATEELAAVSEGASVSGPVADFCRSLDARGLLDAAVPALPGEEDRRRALFALREAVPEGVNRRVRDRALASGGAVAKSGGDVIVPFDRFPEALARWRALVAETGLDCAVWGHISDGNVHPNLIARDADGMARARAAQVAIGKVAIELGGSPLAEHGTGRNPAKQALMLALHGEAGVASMRETKRALDPAWQLAPGVLFPR